MYCRSSRGGERRGFKNNENSIMIHHLAKQRFVNIEIQTLAPKEIKGVCWRAQDTTVYRLEQRTEPEGRRPLMNDKSKANEKWWLLGTVRNVLLRLPPRSLSSALKTMDAGIGASVPVILATTSPRASCVLWTWVRPRTEWRLGEKGVDRGGSETDRERWKQAAKQIHPHSSLRYLYSSVLCVRACARARVRACVRVCVCVCVCVPLPLFSSFLPL